MRARCVHGACMHSRPGPAPASPNLLIVESPTISQAEICGLAAKESNALLLPSLSVPSTPQPQAHPHTPNPNPASSPLPTPLQAPPAFPEVALGTANYIDETAAMSALRSVDGLQVRAGHAWRLAPTPQTQPPAPNPHPSPNPQPPSPNPIPTRGAVQALHSRAQEARRENLLVRHSK